MSSKDIGALWLKDGKNGKFMSGKIEIDGQAHDIVVFKNGYKEKPNQPDYKIYPSQPRGQQVEDSDDVPF